MCSKRFVSIFLCLVILLNVYPTAYAATASQKPDDIPDIDVFLKYPEFLVCQSANDVTNKSADQCFAILNTRTSANDIAAVAATLLKDATSITVGEVAAKLGWKSSYEEKILRSATEKFLSSLPDTAEISIDAANKTSEILKGSGAVLKAINKSKDLPSYISKMFSDMGISDSRKKADDFCSKELKRFSSIISDGSKALDIYKSVIAMFTLYCYRWETVNTLLQYVDENSDLYKGLTLVKSDMSNPEAYVRRHFAEKPILKQISKWASKKVDELFAFALGISKPMSAVLDLAKTLYFDYIYDGYTVDQYAEAVYLLGFSQSIETSIRNLQKKFIAYEGTNADITSYGELYGAWITAQMASLQECSDLVDILKEYDLKTDALEHRSYLEQIYNYSFYLHLCKKNIAAAMDKGQLKQAAKPQTSNKKQTTPAKKTPKPLPTDFSLSTDKSSYILGESVAITPSANNATHYAISVWRGAFKTGERLYVNYNLPGGITFTPPTEGSYTIRADAKNATGYISLEKTFTVAKANANDLPTNFTVRINKDSYVLGESVAITPSADNATHYAISIWFGAFETGEQLYVDYHLPGGIYFNPPKPGTYTIRADAKNSAGYLSTEKTFSVTESASEIINATSWDITNIPHAENQSEMWHRLYMKRGSSFQIQTQFYPSNSNSNVGCFYWILGVVEDKGVTVSDTGLISASSWAEDSCVVVQGANIGLKYISVKIVD